MTEEKSNILLLTVMGALQSFCDKGPYTHKGPDTKLIYQLFT